MSPTSPPPTPRAATAGAAFLRGVERRAGLLARLQCGDARQGAAAVAAAGREFAGLAPALPMEQWPLRYWSLLMAAPELRGQAAGRDWPPALEWLGGMPAAARAVLLLRLVARLEVDQVAAVLEVPASAVQSVLREAVPRHPDGSHDAAAWQARQAALRDALEGFTASTRPVDTEAPPSRPRTRSRGARILLWAALAACVVALAVTFVVPLRLSLQPSGVAGETGPAEAVPLPPYEAPAPAPELAQDPDLALLAHPDLEQLAAAADASLVRDLGFQSWYAARLLERGDAGAKDAGDAR